MSKITPDQETFLAFVASEIAGQERLNQFATYEALKCICEYYNHPTESTALDLYFFLRTHDESRAMVHQFREYTRTHQLNENDTTVNRQFTPDDKISMVKGAIIGALGGGHIDGRDGASYCKAVLASIAEILDITIPEDLKAANGLH
jgi:hypothetical protein